MGNKSDKIIFNLPVTKSCLEQYVVVHNEIGASQRDIQASMGILFDTTRSIGWINGVINKNALEATKINANEDLSPINVSANDELYYHNLPILSAICTKSLYAPLLLKANQRDAETWAIALWDLAKKVYNPDSVILDGLASLQAGHKMGIENVHIIYDTFHILQDLMSLRRAIGNKVKSSRTNLESITAKLKKAKTGKRIINYTKQKGIARRDLNKKLLLCDKISTLCSWIQHDILVVAGVSYQDRLDLLLFIADLFQEIEPQWPNKIRPIRKSLQKNAEKLLGFVKTLDDDLNAYANEIGCDVYWLWQICILQRYSKSNARYHQLAAKIKSKFRENFIDIEAGVIATIANIEKASSVVENLNGRVRKFLRNHIHVSQLQLELLRFIMNHTPFLRSRCEHRHGKSPAEVLHGKEHPHWLEMLGYKMFKKSA